VTADAPPLRVSEAVAAALAGGRPVVALESTVFSRLGLPEEAGAEARRRAESALDAAGAVAALTVVLDGVARVGVAAGEHPLVLAAGRKVAERDLPVALAQRWPAGATTVSAALALAAAAGIGVFATGGIGGVHRHFGDSGDESADLVALARRPVVTVCAGAKSFLDLPRTLERLETLGVPVVGLGTDGGAFPGFWSRRSGGPLVPHEVSSPGEAAAVVAAARALGWAGGVLVVTPVPAGDEVPYDELRPVIDAALAEAAAAGVRGGAVTPFVLERIAAATGGRTVRANVALVEHNAAVAGAIAAALAQGPNGRRQMRT